MAVRYEFIRYPKSLCSLLRQIKNIVATAHALAKKQGSRVQFEHIQRAVSINEKFVREFYGQDYVDSVYK